jgi:hypothetical protein
MVGSEYDGELIVIIENKYSNIYIYWGSNLTLVVYHLHGKPIRFEIVLMVSKISDRKSHSDYALSI